MKKVWVLQSLLLLLPPVFAYVLRDDLALLFVDRRAVFQAERLEDIEGVAAGGRAERVSPSETRKHTVQKGDTWWGIARQYGIRDRNALQRHNGNIELRPGVEVEIPKALAEEP